MMVSKTIRLKLNPSRRKAEELKYYMEVQSDLINTILARIMIRYIQDPYAKKETLREDAII
jgi:hypothetical protein